MANELTRRQFIRQTCGGLMRDSAAAVLAAMGMVDAVGGSEKAKVNLPQIKLGELKVSRLILGSNPFFGFNHGNPQASGDEMRKYYTQEQIMAVMDQAAESGISAVWTPCYEHWIRLWNKYQEKGGKLKIWLGQPDNFDEMKEHITACAKNGGKAICIQGECVDRAFAQRKYDLVRQWLELIKSFDLPAGIATHKPTTHLVAEEKNLPADFYHQCIYQPENYSKECRDTALDTIKKLDKPVVAYKVLAAGRLSPEVAFPYVFKHLKPKDGICVGVFTKNNPNEILENSTLTRKLSSRMRTEKNKKI